MRVCVPACPCVRGMAWRGLSWGGVGWRACDDGSSQGALQLLRYGEVHQTALDVGVEPPSSKQRSTRELKARTMREARAHGSRHKTHYCLRPGHRLRLHVWRALHHARVIGIAIHLAWW